MKFFLISDNIDTQMGMRIAGIEGVVVHTEDEVTEALDKAYSDESIAVVLITEKLVKLCHDRVYQMKLSSDRPLIVEIPDRHGSSHVSEVIDSYIEEALGVKL